MVQFVLIRPGATEFDEQGRIQGTLEIPLCPRGASEVERLCGELKSHGIEALYTSPACCACQTAEALGKALGVKVKKIDTLENLDQGLWQGMLIEEVKHKQPTVYRQWQDQPETICPPGGEMVGEARERVEGALRKIIKKHKTGTIGLVVPEPLASVAQSYLTHADLGDLWKAESLGASWSAIEIDPLTQHQNGNGQESTHGSSTH